MKKALKILLGVLLLLLIVYLAGPRTPRPDLTQPLPGVPTDLALLEESIAARESEVPLKPDNHARIIWSRNLRVQTPLSLVYLHGFSASQMEGDPIHTQFAHRYGINGYLARLAEHGTAGADPMANLTADSLLASGLHALAVGARLGEKVILMGTSTGGTLALYLAARFPDLVHAVILYSPNIDLYDPNAHFLVRPWGYQIAKAVTGSAYREWTPPQAARQYWHSRYMLKATLPLKAIIDATMTEHTFSEVMQPLLLLYYYKNEDEQDMVVSVPRMLEMYDQVGTPPEKKRQFPLPDAGHHILTSPFFSRDLSTTENHTYSFAEEILNLQSTLKEYPAFITPN